MACAAINARTGHVYWDTGASTMQLKRVTPGSRCSVAAIGAGDAGAALSADSRNAADRNCSFYLTCGLALAAFPHSDQQKITARIVDAEQGPITMLKCSACGHFLATGIVRRRRIECTSMNATGTCVQLYCWYETLVSTGHSVAGHGLPNSFEILIWRTSAGAPSTRLRLKEDPIDMDFGGDDGVANSSVHILPVQ